MSCLDCFDLKWAAKRKPPVIFIEGNVAVGKSECVRYCAELLREKGKKIKCIIDETERWETSGTLCRGTTQDLTEKKVFCAYGPLLDFLDRERFYRSRDANLYDAILVERHPSVVTEVFHDEDESVKRLYGAVGAISSMMDPPKHTVYIVGAPAICQERLRRRNKFYETDVDEERLQELEKKLEDCFKKREAEGGKVHRIDAFGATSNHVSTLMSEYIEKVLN